MLPKAMTAARWWADKLRDTSWIDEEDAETQQNAHFLLTRVWPTENVIRDFEVRLAKVLDAEIKSHTAQWLQLAYHSCVVGYGSTLGGRVFSCAEQAGFGSLLTCTFFSAMPKGSYTWLHHGTLEATTEREGTRVVPLIHSW